MRRRLEHRISSVREELAYRDDLTGLFNRRLLDQLLEGWWDDLLTPDEKLSLIMIDLDGFKQVNDRYGHLAGDTVLRSIAQILVKHFRKGDVITRFGGDEFVVLLPAAPASEAAAISERARQAIAEHRFVSEHDGEPIEVPVSFSIGVASYPDDGETGPQLLDMSDRRLYEQKRKRRAAFRDRDSTYRRWLMAATAAVVVSGGVLGIQMMSETDPLPPGDSRQEPTPTAPGWSQREQELLAEIDSLQRQLGELAARAEDQPAADQQAEERRIAELTHEIEQLQKALRRSRSEAVERRPTRLVTPTRLPAPSRTPMQRAQPTEPVPVVIRPQPTATPRAEPVTTVLPTAVVEVPPVLKRELRPYYPDLARRHRIEAIVNLRVVVDTAGRVVRVDLIGEPVGYGLDNAAKRAAYSASFKPGTRNGIPVEMETTVTIRFQL
jgi:TonB family protein